MVQESAFYAQPDGPWQECVGPANWFTLECPDDLVIEQCESLIRIFLPGDVAGKPLLSIEVWWDETGMELPENPPNLGVLFPRLVLGKSLPAIGINIPHDVHSGTSQQAQIQGWRSVLIPRKSCYQWRLWRFRQGSLCIAAVTTSADGDALSDQQVALCCQILETLEVSDAPAWPPDVFQRRALELARKHFPLLNSRISASFTLRLGESEVSLSSMYRLYLQQTDSFRQIVLPGLTSMVRMQELGSRFQNPCFNDVQHQILPVIVRDSTSGPEDRILLPWLANLSIGFVIDEEDTYRFVTHRLANVWKTDQEQLYEIGIANLDQQVRNSPPRFTLGDLTDEFPVLEPVSRSPYNSSLILLPSVRDLIRTHLGQQVIVSLPSRDCFSVISSRDQGSLTALRQRQNSGQLQSVEERLTDQLLLLSADGVSELHD